MSNGSKNLKLAAMGIASALLLVSVASADTLFSWQRHGAEVTTNPGGVAGYTPAPLLDNSNAGIVGANMAGRNPKAVVTGYDLLPSTITTIYGSQNVKYTFGDFEGPGTVARTTNLVSQIKASAGTGASVLANTSYIGNFDVTPLSVDPTRVNFNPGYTFTDYTNAGVNMANTVLYPGGNTFRSPLLGGANGSSAPNLRSSLFTLPITRATLVSANMPLGNKHIPYVARFNNFGSTWLDSDGNSANGFRFDNPTGNQMLSRGDFKAMIAHYRLRGVDGVHLLDPGVEGYTQAQAEQDVAAGWNLPQINAIFNGANPRLATLDTVIRTDGTLKGLEDAGVVASGVYSLTQNKLALLISNLDELSHSVSFSAKTGGKNLPGSYFLAAGQHKLLEFTGSGTQWVLSSSTILFSNVTDSDRSGVGVPEPTMLGGVALMAVFGLSRRRRTVA